MTRQTDGGFGLLDKWITQRREVEVVTERCACGQFVATGPLREARELFRKHRAEKHS